MRRILLFTALLVSIFSTILAETPPPDDDKNTRVTTAHISESQFKNELVDFVYGQYLRYGEGKISEEKYLVSLMYLINDEVSRRLVNPKQKRREYFQNLSDMLSQINTLKRRLKTSGIRELDTFVGDLENRIRVTLDGGEIDYNKKRAFENALQMLYVSEEMIKLDKTEGGGDLTEKIGKSKQEILAAFGEGGYIGSGSGGKVPTIYDFFVEWKRTDEVSYERRIDDVYLVRRNLLKSSSTEGLLRMFNHQLSAAYLEFNYGDYDLAEQLLGDLIVTYPVFGLKNMDDLYFYRAECNFALGQYMHARENYESLLNEFETTQFRKDAYSRLIEINYTLNDYAGTVAYADKYIGIAAPGEETFYDNQFLAAMAHRQLGSYDRTIEALLTIPVGHPYYHVAQYFIGNAYSDNQLYDEAVRTYLSLIEDDGTPPRLHAHGLYKMGILEYEWENFSSAIDYLSRIPTGFSQYDKALNALAWAHFEQARSNPDAGSRDFNLARYYAQSVVDEYYASPYKMEATSLLAYINQLENEPVDAIGLYREVYQTKVKRTSIEAYVDERNQLEDALREAQNLREESLKKNDLPAYNKANILRTHLEDELTALDFMETSSTGLSVHREMSAVTGQLKELARLRVLAENAGNKDAVHDIDSMQVRLAVVLESFPREVVEDVVSFNLFDDYPVSKHVVEEERLFSELNAKRDAVMEEIGALNKLIVQVDDKISMAKVDGDFSLVGQLELKRRQLQRLKKRHDNLLVSIHKMDVTPNPYPEFNRWGDLGAFGIINVYFDQKQKMQYGLVRVADVLSRVNAQLDTRKEVIEDKIKKIEAEVRLMTMKARLEERRRLRAERERAFRESYFDTRESETEEEQP